MKALQQTLVKHFGDEKYITTLKSLTKKIATISKVRVGKEESRTVTNYAEVSLQNINNLGYITIPDDYEGHAPANETSIKRQALNYHDIILPFRSSYYNTIGLVQKSYDKYPVIVGNNSMIRIEFEEERREDTPMYVYNYLKLHIIRDFITSICLPQRSSNPLTYAPTYYLTPSILESLPIPIFKESEGAYKEYIHSRLSILDTFDSIRDTMWYLIDNLEKLEIKGEKPDFSKVITFSSQTEKTYLISEAIKEFEQKLKSIVEPDAYKEYQETQLIF